MTRDERIWTSVKFTLLLLFSVTLMYILLCKYVIQIPMFETDLLIKNIDGSEEILTDQKKMAEEVKALKADIDSLNFEIQQVQHTGEIKTRILQMQSVYKTITRDTYIAYRRIRLCRDILIFEKISVIPSVTTNSLNKT